MISMDEFKYYAEARSDCTVLWKVSKKLCTSASDDYEQTPGLSACISLGIDLDDSIPMWKPEQQTWRITKDAFRKKWNLNYDALQKARIHGGDYYLERVLDNWLTIHAFLRNPSRHYSISFRQDAQCAEIILDTEMTIIYRRGIANHNEEITEGVFIQAFKHVLEFFLDGSAIPVNYEKLWEVLDTLVGSSEPEMPPVINEDYHYQKVCELILKRKNEIKLRLLEFDDSPSKRRELRAEMKGLDFCVSIMEKNL